jgi:hypothetical protein
MAALLILSFIRLQQLYRFFPSSGDGSSADSFLHQVTAALM